MAKGVKREFADTIQVAATRAATVEKLMRLKVVTPERVVFEGTARSLVAPAWDGWVGILPGHAPFLTLMGEGPLSVEPESGGRREFQVGGGVMKVESNEVTVLADRVEVPPMEVELAAVLGVSDRLSLEGSGGSGG